MVQIGGRTPEPIPQVSETGEVQGMRTDEEGKPKPKTGAPAPRRGRTAAVKKKAKKSIANFGLREGQEIGASVTLRGARMWEFLDRFISTAVPRIRDFRGLSTRSFDGRGNYSLGVKEQMIFPEINYDMVEQIHGMDITVVTTTNKDDQALALLRELGMPFRGEDKPIVVNM